MRILLFFIFLFLHPIIFSQKGGKTEDGKSTFNQKSSSKKHKKLSGSFTIREKKKSQKKDGDSFKSATDRKSNDKQKDFFTSSKSEISFSSCCETKYK